MNIALLTPEPVATVSGGYLYDRLVAESLRRRGHRVTNAHGPQPDLAALESADVWLQDELGHEMYLPLNRRPHRPPIVGLVHVPAAVLCPSDDTAAREAAYLSTVDAAVFVSEATRRDTRDRLGTLPDTTIVAHPGADHVARPIGLAAPGRGIVSVGHILPHKGHLDLIVAMADAREREPRAFCDTNLVIVGAAVDRPHTDRVRFLARERSVPVEFCGELSGVEVASLVARADVFVQASHYESYGIAAAEAIALGTPVITCSRGGPREWLGSDHAILCEPGDREALTRALVVYQSDAQLRAKLRAGARRARLPTWDDAADRIERLLRAL